ncbi:MAG: serine/threonine protein kinase [Myxococcales bacterium]|nr:serine/threonine protein kinase [Myxococcales bacterium]MCB9579864.1 serine/threonine protein kinase [Polyangiaceae bacterium]
MHPGVVIARKYRLIRRLAEGGMAEVWAAQNVLTQRDFAIKLILPQLAKSPEILGRFLQEARTTGRLRHPSIVDVFDVGQTETGKPFIVMELLHGESLEDRLNRERRLAPLAVSVMLVHVARALDLAHRAGIVHRDLSPANVFLARTPNGDEIPKILDFGVSKLMDSPADVRVRTGNGAVLGSPGYMSPEQARGADTVDARTDVWTLGVLLYEALSGQPPFDAKNYNALMLAIMTVPHTPLGVLMPELPDELVDVVESCLVKDREARTQSAEDVAKQLDHVVRVLEQSPRRRRVTDRLPLPDRVTPLPRAARMPPRTYPLGIRCWQFLSRSVPPKGVVAASGALGGTAVGLALGVALSANAPPSPLEARLPALARVAQRVEVAEAEPAVKTAPASAKATTPREKDLVRAAARGLGIAAKKPKRGKRATKLALLPRSKNPY